MTMLPMVASLWNGSSFMPAPEQYGWVQWGPESLLAALSASEQESILTLGYTHQYPSGEILFHQGDPSDFVVIIIDGFVKITAVSRSGTQSLVAIRTAGDIIGELASFDGQPRSATARAADAVLARVILKPQLDRLLQENFTITRAFHHAVSNKLREATRRHAETGRDTRSRLAQVLVELYRSPGNRGHEPAAILATQSELANLIGASEPAVHKALRALRDEGVIRPGYRHLTIVDIARLRQIADDGTGNR
jgi:CRP-like cAMP-binding protein